MPSIKLQVDGEAVDLDLSVDAMTLREHARLQSQVGNVRYDRFLTTGAVELRPDFLAAFVWARLASTVDVEPDDIDCDFVALVEALQELGEGKA